MKIVNSNTALFLIATLSFIGLYEVYPRPGWVDASMYLGYAINPDIYKIYHLATHNYQGSRLGYILPSIFINTIFGNLNGRLIYVFILFSAYFSSVLILTRFFIKNTIERMLLGILFILNPCFISSIFYGGADGPAAVQLLLAISLLVYASRLFYAFQRNLLSFVSGIFLILSISSHIFATIPTLLIVPALLYVLKQKQLVVPMILGGFAATLVLNYFGYFYGLDQFYLLYSLPWATKSLLAGVGAQFVDPLAHWIKNAIFWCPIIISLPIFFIFNRNLLSRNTKQFPLAMASLLNIAAPIIIYALYDMLARGNTLATPAYFNIIYPSFMIGLIMMFALENETVTGINIPESGWGINKKHLALFVILFANTIISFSSGHIKHVFLFNEIRSENLYRSQLSFVDRLKFLALGTRKFQFVLTAAGPEVEQSPRFYMDNFKGAPRYFDYLDSLTGLFQWDRSTALRLDPGDDLEKAFFEPKKNTPIVFLGRNKAEVVRLVTTLKKHLDGYTASNYECFDDDYYPWCFVEFKFINHISNLRILDWGPKATLQGEVFNAQPDGNAAIWIKLSGDEELGTAQVMFGGQPALSTYVGLGGISTKIPADLYNTPGVRDISIKQVFTGRVFPVGTFDVEKKNINGLKGLKVLNWGPQSTSKGIVPNMQPDGSAGIWIQVSEEQGLGKLQVEFNGIPLKTFVGLKLITAAIAPEYFGTSGKNRIFIRQVSTGELVSVGVFNIDD